MRHISLLLAVCIVAIGGAARGEVFQLNSAGQIRGELVNPDESPRKTYVIKTAAGGQVTLDKSQVKKVVKETAAELEYLRIRGDYADTAEGQWDLAEWCRKNHLSKFRKTHLERVIELDPNHAPARRGLGYSQVQGQWVTQEQRMTERGFVRYHGTWVMPQEVELREEERKTDLAQKDWFKKLKRWRGWLDGDRAPAAEEEIAAIKDPYAVKPLGQYLAEETDRSVKTLYIDALARIGTADAMQVLTRTSIDDADEEVRLSCLDKVAGKKFSPAVHYYVQKLKSKDNVLVNRAGVGLARMKDPATTGPLIEGLVTTHSFKVVAGPPPGQMSSTFGGSGSGAGGFSFGSPSPKIIKRRLPNREVLSALIALTGKNFDFDVQAWKAWFAKQQKPKGLDARRD